MNTQAINISIPKPCHEDWNKMTPDQKGAFCGVCQKSVVDFSKKTDTQIINIIKDAGSQKICGRFAPDQLNRKIENKKPKGTVLKISHRMRAFAAALYLVFGMSLFACNSSDAQKMGKVKIEVMGDVQYIPEKTDTVKTITPTKDTTAQTTNLNIKGELYLERPEYMLGGPVVTNCNILQETVNEDTVIQTTVADTLITDVPEPLDTYPVMGLISPDFYPEDTLTTIIEQPETIDTTQLFTTEKYTIENSDEVKSNMVLFPNPTNGMVNINYELKTRTDVRIDVLNTNGDLVKTLSNISAQYSGKYQLSYDLSELSNGTYYCVITTGAKKETSKIIIIK
jgi:hypothetical protein